jgi:hypothetical protein
MSVQVSISDLMGTAQVAAEVAALEIKTARENAEQAVQRIAPLERAISELVQSLSEVVIASPYAIEQDVITKRGHRFEARCEVVAKRIREAIAPFEV